LSIREVVWEASTIGAHGIILPARGHALDARRKVLTEPAFGLLKRARGFRQFLLRGLATVQGE